MAMKITRKEVEYVAHLARLKLSEEDAENFTTRLDQILNYFEKLKELDTTGVEPTSHSMPMVNAFREDEVMPSLSIDEALANAPDKEGNFFKVPKIIE
jgi:aspartyl-tRNA(Asn)/glutamyl-tRNA(Gln) amidotransferase subunit C